MKSQMTALNNFGMPDQVRHDLYGRGKKSQWHVVHLQPRDAGSGPVFRGKAGYTSLEFNKQSDRGHPELDSGSHPMKSQMTAPDNPGMPDQVRHDLYRWDKKANGMLCP